MQQRHPHPRAADRTSWTQGLRRPKRPFSSYLPPRAARRQAHTCPVARPQTARQPRRQRRVARLSATATVCTENHEKPQISPFRVLLPRPPGGGLGAGGQGVPDASQCRLEKQPTPATASQCSKAIRTPGPPTVQHEGKTIPALWRRRTSAKRYNNSFGQSASISAINLNCVRVRSRFCPGRCVLK